MLGRPKKNKVFKGLKNSKFEENNNTTSFNTKDKRMSSTKRISMLSSVSLEEIRQEFEKPVKKTLTHRFTLQLLPSDETKFSEFYYNDMVDSLSENGPTLTNEEAGHLFGDSTDASDVKVLAKKFEQKYGGSSTTKRKIRLDDFVDVGYGYDESDSFLDNSEAYDELVPHDWAPEHGGFYINQGNLDFRQVENNASSSIIQNSTKKKKKLLAKDLTTKKKKSQILTKEKQRKKQESLCKAQRILNKKKQKKNKENKPEDMPNKSQEDTFNKSYEDDLPLSIIKETSGKEDTQLNAESLTPPLCSDKQTPVVVKELPENLSPSILEHVKKLKELAASCTVKGKKFFAPEVNDVLVLLARECKLQTPKMRNGVYDHILCFIPCSKDTLVKRMRALVVQHQRDMVDEPMRLLKAAIDESMVEQQKNHEEELAAPLQEQAKDQSKQTGDEPYKVENTKNGEEEKVKKPLPKKKYIWNDTVRKLLLEVVRIRVGLYKLSKSKSMSAEEYIKEHLENGVRTLWPKGWMTSRVLYKESKSAHNIITQPLKLKQVKLMTKTSIASPSSITTITSPTSIVNGCKLTPSSVVVVPKSSVPTVILASAQSTTATTNRSIVSSPSATTSLLDKQHISPVNKVSLDFQQHAKTTAALVRSMQTNVKPTFSKLNSISPVLASNIKIVTQCSRDSCQYLVGKTCVATTSTFVNTKPTFVKTKPTFVNTKPTLANKHDYPHQQSQHVVSTFVQTKQIKRKSSFSDKISSKSMKSTFASSEGWKIPDFSQSPKLSTKPATSSVFSVDNITSPKAWNTVKSVQPILIDDSPPRSSHVEHQFVQQNQQQQKDTYQHVQQQASQQQVHQVKQQVQQRQQNVVHQRQDNLSHAQYQNNQGHRARLVNSEQLLQEQRRIIQERSHASNAPSNNSVNVSRSVVSQQVRQRNHEKLKTMLSNHRQHHAAVPSLVPVNKFRTTTAMTKSEFTTSPLNAPPSLQTINKHKAPVNKTRDFKESSFFNNGQILSNKAFSPPQMNNRIETPSFANGNSASTHTMSPTKPKEQKYVHPSTFMSQTAKHETDLRHTQPTNDIVSPPPPREGVPHYSNNCVSPPSRESSNFQKHSILYSKSPQQQDQHLQHLQYFQKSHQQQQQKAMRERSLSREEKVELIKQELQLGAKDAGSSMF